MGQDLSLRVAPYMAIRVAVQEVALRFKAIAQLVNQWAADMSVSALFHQQQDARDHEHDFM